MRLLRRLWAELLLAPDFAEPLVGWRCWSLGSDGLRSCHVPERWTPYERLQAWHRREHPFVPEVAAHALTGDEGPLEGCVCGIFAHFEELGAVKRAAAKRAVAVVGRVKLWGRVIECETGWKAQFAYPAELFVLVQRIRPRAREEFFAAATGYGVPCSTLTFRAWQGREDPQVGGIAGVAPLGLAA